MGQCVAMVLSADGTECELVSQYVAMILSMSQCGYGTECEPVRGYDT